MTVTDTAPRPRLLRLPSVMHLVGKGKTSLYQAVAAGEFPKPVKIGARAAAWLESEVDAWIAEQVARRDAEVPRD